MRNWTSQDIYKAIKTRNTNHQTSLIENSLDLKLFDEENSIGIGETKTHRTVLLLPGQSNVTAFETKYSKFIPWLDITKIQDGATLEGVALLECEVDYSNESNLEAIVALFVGIIDLQIIFKECGKAIWQLKEFFESNFTNKVPENVITGLLGEMLIIVSAKNPNIAFSFWHNIVEDKYDFSGESFRLDVKTTISTQRRHHFSSSQIPGLNPDKTFIASILVNRVRSGMSFVTFIDKFLEPLTIVNRQEALNTILSILKTPFATLDDYLFDYEGTISTIEIYPSSNIPAPIRKDGVLNMSWEAELINSNLDFQWFDSKFFVLND